MGITEGSDVYKAMGVRRVINCYGAVSLLGASSASPSVWKAMQQANDQYAEMHELMTRSGEIISDILGVEATAMTTGGTGALVLSFAAAMTGSDSEKISRIPDTTGMKNEVLLQRPDLWHFERAVTQTGAKVVRVGGEKRCTPEEIEAAIGPKTAALIWCYSTSGRAPKGSLVPPEELVRIGRERSVPVIIDGAGSYPTDRMRQIAQTGDLVCFGSKYIGGPNSAGYVCGRKDLIEAVNLQGYVAWMEFRSKGMHGGIGRSMKFDRAEIVACVVSLQEWIERDHHAVLQESEKRLKVIQDELTEVPHIETTITGSYESGRFQLQITPDAAALGKTARDIAIELAQGNPAVWIVWAPREPDYVGVSVYKEHLREGEEHIVAKRLREVITGDGRPSMDDVVYHPAFYTM